MEGDAFIVREHGSGTRVAMESFFAERRFAPRITMEMSSNETIKQALMAGMGLSFLSLHTTPRCWRNGRHRPSTAGLALFPFLQPLEQRLKEVDPRLQCRGGGRLRCRSLGLQRAQRL